MTPPFQYPPAPHTRRHGPQGYADYSRFRPWLRDEFSFRCVYCLLREQWGRDKGTFTIDHFVAVAIDANLETDYDNLLYACVTCNNAKGAQVLPNPLPVLTSAAVRVEGDGTIHADANSEAARLIELLGLDSQKSTEFRKLWIDIIALAQQRPDLYQRLMGYPDDLPDLRRRRCRPPGGNTRPAGVEHPRTPGASAASCPLPTERYFLRANHLPYIDVADTRRLRQTHLTGTLSSQASLGPPSRVGR